MTAPALQITCITDPEALTACREDWDQCVADQGGDIYFTVDWLQVWWRHFGKGRRFLACLVTSDDQTVAALPFVMDRFGLGPLSVTLARLAGTDYNYPVMGLAVQRESAAAIWQVVIARLLQEGSHSICLSPLSEQVPDLDEIATAAAHNQLAVAPETQARTHIIMALPDSFDAYMDSLSSSRRKEYRRSRNKVDKTYAATHMSSDPGSISQMFKDFVALHAQQWKAVGKGGHFSDWPGSTDFYQELFERLAPSGRGLVEVHQGNGEVLSSRLTFLFGPRAYWRLTARSLDAAATKMGVSKVAMVQRIEQRIAAGTKTIEMGIGEYGYKLGFGGEAVSARRVLLQPKGLRGLPARLLVLWSEGLNLVYYRIWFQKLAPKWRKTTGAKPAALWRSWVRSRL